MITKKIKAVVKIDHAVLRDFLPKGYEVEMYTHVSDEDVISKGWVFGDGKGGFIEVPDSITPKGTLKTYCLPQKMDENLAPI